MMGVMEGVEPETDVDAEFRLWDAGETLFAFIWLEVKEVWQHASSDGFAIPQSNIVPETRKLLGCCCTVASLLFWKPFGWLISASTLKALEDLEASLWCVSVLCEIGEAIAASLVYVIHGPLMLFGRPLTLQLLVSELSGDRTLSP